MTNICRFVSALSLLLLPFAAAAADCKIERAVYRPLGTSSQPGGGYELVHAAKTIPVNMSKLVAIIRQSGTKRVHEFGFAFSNGYGRTHLLYSGPDKYDARKGNQNDDADGPNSTIIYFDAGLKVVDAPVNPGVAAPEYLIMPELGGKFYYMGRDGRQFVPTEGLWKLASCK